ncbi:Ig-like domain-containing protein [Allokutzneria multivorans]|uniref:Ig-like domain-containing protein n=1 Tax=Allokutzneria multivorans TaxID=1142134 RepID=A0ABP7SUC0_9PSEU
MLGRRRALAVGTLGLVAAFVSGCTGGGGGQGAPGGGGQPGGGGSTPTTPPGPATLALVPAEGSQGVAPGEPVTVTATGGKLGEVSLLNPDGKPVAGQVSQDGLKWTSTETLGYNKSYTLNATATGTDGKPVTAKSAFSTVKPRRQAFVSMNPLDGQTVGVGQPLAFIFDVAPPNKEAAQKAIQVTAEPKAEGAFYWFSDKEVHWRPREYWKPGTKVSIDVKVYGKDLGGGIYGQEDRKAAITIGDAVIAEADGGSHQMVVKVNGQVVKEMPVSLGSAKFPSNNGIHVVTEKHPTKVMDSTSYGLPLDRGGYRTKVNWAVRISNGGEFTHAAPWSVRDQGRRNVSHGCINMSTENAKWYFDTVKKGDIVVITNSGGPDLRSWDGFGDWQIPWEEWLKGGKK